MYLAIQYNYYMWSIFYLIKGIQQIITDYKLDIYFINNLIDEHLKTTDSILYINLV